VVDKFFSVASPSEVITQSRFFVGLIEKDSRLTIEANDVSQHVSKRPAKYIRGLSENPPETPTRPLQARPFTRQTKAHITGLSSNFEISQQACEIRIRFLVINDKARIDRMSFPSEINFNRMAMTTNPGIGLVNRHVSLRMQPMGRHKPRYSASDDRNPHPFSPLSDMSV
jgi:hypothetical protein